MIDLLIQTAPWKLNICSIFRVFYMASPLRSGLPSSFNTVLPTFASNTLIMSKQKHVSETPATQLLKRSKVAFIEHVYEYVDHGGTDEASRQLGFDGHRVVKTLIMEDDQAKPLVMLMHGDHEVSTKNLARQIGVKRVTVCAPDVAQRHSGYLVGGTSPFGTRKPMPVYVQKSVLDCETILINGGRRGYLLEVAPSVLVQVLKATPVDVAID